MKRNTVAVVTTLSTVMLGAGWAAGVIGAAANAGSGGISIDALGSGSDTAGSTLSPSPTATGNSGLPSPSVNASASPSAAAADPAAAAPAPAAPAPAAPAPAAPAPAAPPPAPSGTFDGATVQTAYGNYQVQVAITAGQITNIVMLQSGSNDADSRQISGSALPTLQQRVLSAQSWNVQGFSGASWTSRGFTASVQSAMQAAGLA